MASGDRLVHHRQNLGCLLISSPQGQSGKTIITVGLCDVLKRRGLSIQPFKKGPDYIDPSWLTIAAGRSCRNLDLFLIPKNKLIQTFQQASDETDLVIVEGAMGLYDGLDAQGTTAEIARLLNIPVVLVVNTSRMTSSIAAMVTGYQHFQKDVPIAGVILNYVSGTRHESKLRNAVEQYCGIPVVGSIPRDQDLRIVERHLGLIPSSEAGEAELWVERIGRKLESHFDLDRILTIAREFGPPHPFPLPPGEREKKEYTLPQGEREPFITPRPLGERGKGPPRVRLGVMRDQVFNFYYPENLEALGEAGADLVFINSLQDRLPQVDGLYIGGGFPEFFLEKLEKNKELRQELWEAIEQGLPVYAECAGLMYLCRSVSWRKRSYKMVGVIPSEINLSERPEGHGYVVAKVINENPLFPVGLTLRGHEFHHSSLLPIDDLQFAYQIQRGKGITGQKDGIVYKNLFASYVHLHALGTPEWVEGFVALASKGKRAIRKLLHAKNKACHS